MATHGLHRIAGLWVTVALAVSLGPPSARADAPSARMAVLARGLNVAHWMRFPPSHDPRRMTDYLSDPELAALKQAGFTYLRIPVGLEVVMNGRRIATDKLRVITAIVGRVQKAGLGVMIEPHPQDVPKWDFRANAEAREVLLGFWRDLAPALRPFPAGMTFPEVVNEPTFDDPAGWDRFQAEIVSLMRASLPDNTLILTGTNWSSLEGLLKVTPLPDPNVVYSFHTYDPALLTISGNWDPKINQDEIRRNIPFPATEPGCRTAKAAIKDAYTRSVMDYWCAHPGTEQTIAETLGRASGWGHRHGVSVALTEFGANGSLNAPARNAYFAAMRRSTDKLRLPWAVWALDDQMGFGRPTGPGAAGFRLSPDLLAALGLPP